MTDERELTSPVNLCHAGGLDPAAVGWARQPLVRGNLVGPWGRRKRWHYWCLVTPTHVLSITVADVNYLAFAAVWLLELGRGTLFETAAPLWPGPILPTRPIAELRARGPGVEVAFRETAGATRLVVRARSLLGRRLEVNALVSRPPGHETLDVVVPFSAARYALTSKHVGLPLAGQARWRGAVIPLDGWACLDWGRGVWPYRTSWNWAVGAGPGLAFNLGGRWTRGTGMTENALFLDGRLHKLGEELSWEPDRIHGRQVDLAFERRHPKPLRLELGVAGVKLDLAWGRFTGNVVGDDGVARTVDVPGWNEALDARW